MMRVRIHWPGGEITATLKDTPTARALYTTLPCSSRANTWGEEIYFAVAVHADLEPDAQQVVPPGTLCYWVEGCSLAIPYGPTPISERAECRLITEVNILGQVEGDPRLLNSMHDGDTITVEGIPD